LSRMSCSMMSPSSTTTSSDVSVGRRKHVPSTYGDAATTPTASTSPYNVHRWYQPAVGRYTRPDPFGLRYVNNLFAYASLNPVLQADPDGRFPTFPARNPITCSVAGASEARSRGKGMGWRWAHCWASCEITKNCGGEAVAKPFGLVKEVIDLVGCFASSINSVGTGGPCESAFQPTDFEDNDFGRRCPVETPCEERCKDLAGEDVPPGPFFGLSIPIVR
jgi:RHS repeat-associated protein